MKKKKEEVKEDKGAETIGWPKKLIDPLEFVDFNTLKAKINEIINHING